MAANFSSTGSDTFPAGHVVKTSKAYRGTGGHINTSSNSVSDSGISLSVPAATGSNYYFITFSTAGQHGSGNSSDRIYLYCSKNGASQAKISGGEVYWTGGITGSPHDFSSMTWTDASSITAGTNVYKIYYSCNAGTFYMVHSGYPYSFIVQEISV